MTLRIEEVVVDGETYRLREPRLRDFLEAKGLPGQEFLVFMLARMLLSSNGEPVGEEAVGDLPLRTFAPLAEAVNRMVAPSESPLDQTSASSTDSA